MGADFVIAVNIDEPFKKEPLDKFRKAGSVSKRMLKWALYANDAPQEALSDVLIHPFTEGISSVGQALRCKTRSASRRESGTQSSA
ncbi:MAG: hypothetical protein R3D26_10945 [Cyanobacteriota/Melainabacteria group bacterium]